MPTPENPFDRTVPDPFDSRQAIEDPLHGPSAVERLLQTPPMPRGDGTYYQSGGFYASGSVYVDAKDRPVCMVGATRSISAIRRELLKLEEWRQASLAGEEALTALEAQRQQDRLVANGVAHAFKPSDVCAGGQRLEACEMASTMVGMANDYAETIREGNKDGSGQMWYVLAWLGKTCTTCSLRCQVAIQTEGRQPTGITRFSNTRPLAVDFPVMQIGLPPYDT